jgi:hypothetical protein
LEVTPGISNFEAEDHKATSNSKLEIVVEPSDASSIARSPVIIASRHSKDSKHNHKHVTHNVPSYIPKYLTTSIRITGKRGSQVSIIHDFGVGSRGVASPGTRLKLNE